MSTETPTSICIQQLKRETFKQRRPAIEMPKWGAREERRCTVLHQIIK